MTNKPQYESPRVECVLFDRKDVLTESSNRTEWD